MLNKLHESLTDMIFSKKSLEDANVYLDFNFCQAIFLKEHTQDLNQCLKKQESILHSSVQRMESKKLTI